MPGRTVVGDGDVELARTSMPPVAYCDNSSMCIVLSS